MDFFSGLGTTTFMYCSLTSTKIHLSGLINTTKRTGENDSGTDRLRGGANRLFNGATPERAISARVPWICFRKATCQEIGWNLPENDRNEARNLRLVFAGAGTDVQAGTRHQLIAKSLMVTVGIQPPITNIQRSPKRPSINTLSEADPGTQIFTGGSGETGTNGD